MAARQFTARKTTLPQNILAAVHSSFNQHPFHHIIHVVRNRVAVSKDRAWLVLHQFTMSPLCAGSEKPERPLCSELNFAAALGCSAPLAPGLARSCSCQLCSLPVVPVSCGCCLQAALPCLYWHSQLQAAPMFCWIISRSSAWGVSALREGSVMRRNVVKSLPQKEDPKILSLKDKLSHSLGSFLSTLPTSAIYHRFVGLSRLFPPLYLHWF